MRISMFAFVFATAIAASPAMAVNLVTNGGFETGDFTGWVFNAPYNGVTGTVNGYIPPEGSFQAYFGTIDPNGSGISQTIATSAGALYDVSFWLGNRAGPPNSFRLFWDKGFVRQDFDADPFEYTLVNLKLVATGSSTELGFIFYHQPSNWFLDDVVVVGPPIPEPATWAMLISGFGMVGTAARRRRPARA